MPYLSEPGARFAVVLACDRDKPPESQTRFWYEARSARDFRKLLEADAALDRATDTATYCDRLFALLRERLVDWENVRDPDAPATLAFDPSRLEDILDLWEARDMVAAIATAQTLDYASKKNSASRPASNTAGCAANAAAGGA